MRVLDSQQLFVEAAGVGWARVGGGERVLRLHLGVAHAF